ncbi:MAG: nitroreductase family protein [Bacteroidales bacterium]|jgi:nitroreductase|nr:nitroreductase family protein [Bacteroidales bacterium]
MNAILKQIHERKSVRHFRSDKVKIQDLKEIVRAGMAAPTARNLQAWEFLILDDEKLLSHLSDQLPYAKMLAEVNAAIVVLGDSSVKSPSGHTYWLQDTCAATQNILLASEALGLGAVWTALYPYDERMQPVIKACQLPEHLIPLNIIPIGVPTGDDKPNDKYKPEKIHINQWKAQ